MDQIAEGGELPVPRLRPHGVPGVRPAGDHPAAHGDQQHLPAARLAARPHLGERQRRRRQDERSAQSQGDLFFNCFFVTYPEVYHCKSKASPLCFSFPWHILP